MPMIVTRFSVRNMGRYWHGWHGTAFGMTVLTMWGNGFWTCAPMTGCVNYYQ